MYPLCLPPPSFHLWLAEWLVTRGRQELINQTRLVHLEQVFFAHRWKYLKVLANRRSRQEILLKNSSNYEITMLINDDLPLTLFKKLQSRRLTLRSLPPKAEDRITEGTGEERKEKYPGKQRSCFKNCLFYFYFYFPFRGSAARRFLRTSRSPARIG